MDFREKLTAILSHYFSQAPNAHHAYDDAVGCADLIQEAIREQVAIQLKAAGLTLDKDERS